MIAVICPNRLHRLPMEGDSADSSFGNSEPHYHDLVCFPWRYLPGMRGGSENDQATSSVLSLECYVTSLNDERGP